MPLYCRTLIISLLLASSSLFLMSAYGAPAQTIDSALSVHETGPHGSAPRAIGEERVSPAVVGVGAGLDLAEAAAATPACGNNEEYKECGSACPPTCKDLNPGPCPQQCVSACFCKPGFVRNQSGKCVQPKKCPKQAQ